MIIERSPDEIAAKLALMGDKLGHSLLDIRERAIASLARARAVRVRCALYRVSSMCRRGRARAA